MNGRRLFLVGDDDVLDVIADLSRHLDYFEVSRLDSLPAQRLTSRDHVVIAMEDSAQAALALAEAIGAGRPGFAAVVPALPGASTGARAIVAAAQLVATSQV